MVSELHAYQNQAKGGPVCIRVVRIFHSVASVHHATNLVPYNARLVCSKRSIVYFCLCWRLRSIVALCPAVHAVCWGEVLTPSG